jgi:hypothetical protein
MKVKVAKNKLAPRIADAAEFEFIAGKGIDPYADLIIYAKSVGIIRFAGLAVKLALPNEEEVTMCTGGKNGAQAAIRQDEDLYRKIADACAAKSNPEGEDSEADIDNDDDGVTGDVNEASD